MRNKIVMVGKKYIWKYSVFWRRFTKKPWLCLWVFSKIHPHLFLCFLDIPLWKSPLDVWKQLQGSQSLGHRAGQLLSEWSEVRTAIDLPQPCPSLDNRVLWGVGLRAPRREKMFLSFPCKNLPPFDSIQAERMRAEVMENHFWVMSLKGQACTSPCSMRSRTIP